MIRIFERTSISHHSFPSIAIDGTGGGPLEVTEAAEIGAHCGILRTLGIGCDSTNFDISIRTKFNALPYTTEEIYRYTGINRHMLDDGLFIGWENRDDPLANKLYLVLTNQDPAKATGAFEVTLTNNINRRFSKNR